MSRKKNSPGCNCKCQVTCILLEDSFDRASIGPDWNVISGTWSISSGSLTTSSADALIMWAGSYSASAGVSLEFSTYSESYAIVDYVDDDNYHLITFEAITLAQLAANTYRGNRVKVYKRTGGTNTLVYDFLLGMPGTGSPVVFNSNTTIRFGGGVIAIGSGASSAGNMWCPVAPHGGTKLGFGTTSAASGTKTWAAVNIRHLGSATDCRAMTRGCQTCLVSDDAWDMMVTLKMTNSCSGGALTETNFVLPFTGVTHFSIGSFAGPQCTWTLNSGLPCGWAWMQLIKGATTDNLETEYLLVIAHYNGSTSVNYTRLLFTGASSTSNDCSGSGPWPVKTSGGMALRYNPGTGSFITDGGTFDISACKVTRL